MRVNIIYIYITIFFIGSVNAQNITNKDSLLINAVLYNKLELSYVKSDIDKRLLKYLTKRNSEAMAIVNPKEPYNSTDVIMRGFPRKRLIVLGKSAKKDLGFILYEVGGQIAQNCCLIYKKKTRRIYIFTVLVLDKSIETLEQLRNSIRYNKYYIL